LVAVLVNYGYTALVASAQEEYRPSVVKILATRRGPDLVRPWTKQSPQQVSGSGLVIDGKRILTNAHVVGYTTEVYVQGFQSADKIAAKVLAAAQGIDLAVLSVDDESFFANRLPLPMADDLPAAKDKVNAYGYPVGGTELSITEGIVSRIDCGVNLFETTSLRIQIDAALNAGNSGGPAISNGKVVGLVVSVLKEAEKTGFLIPVEEIRLFLEDIADGEYDGKPQFFDGVQTVENEALRARLGLAAGTGGVMIEHPHRLDPNYPLKEWDVITHIGEQALDSEGKVQVREDLRVKFHYLLPKLAQNETVPLTVFREGKPVKLELPVERERKGVVGTLNRRYPSYFICGPLVFSPATHEFLAGMGEKGGMILQARGSSLITRMFDWPTFEGEELVLVTSRMFPHKIKKGYDEVFGCTVSHVNGVPVKNLRHLVQMLRLASGDFIEFRFADWMAEALVFRRTEFMAATEEILTDNGIRQQYSDDLRVVWEGEEKR